MRTAIARLSGDADLHLRGSVARPAVLGRVDILEGQATFHGTRFTLESEAGTVEGSLAFKDIDAAENGGTGDGTAQVEIGITGEPRYSGTHLQFRRGLDVDIKLDVI